MASFSEYTQKKKKRSFAEYTEAVKAQNTTKDIAPVKSSNDGGKGVFKKSGLWDDGYQAGDVASAILATGIDFVAGMAQGAGQLAEGIVDLGTHTVAAGADLFGADEFAEKAKNFANTNHVEDAFDEFRMIDAPFNSKSEMATLEDASVLGGFGYGVAQGVGQLLPIIATGGMAGAAGAGAGVTTAITTGITGASSMGSGISEAYNDNATDGEAWAYGTMKGSIDAGTELLFGGLGKGVKALGVSRGISSLDDVFAKKLSSKISSQFAKTAVEYGVKASGEGFEEVLAGIGDAAAKKLTYMSDEELDQLIKDENLLEQFAMGAVVSGIAQSGDFVSSTKTGRDFITDLTTNEETVVEAEFQSRVKAEEQNGKKLTNKQKNEIYEQVKEDLQKGYISTDTIESVLGDDKYKAYQDIVTEEEAAIKDLEELYQGDELKAEIDKLLKDSKRGATQAELSKYVQEKLTQQKGKRTLTDTYLVESYNEKARRGQDFKADVSQYDEAQRATIQKAIDSGILNNTRKTHELVDFIAKLSADKGVSFDFTSNEKLAQSSFAVQGKTVNGYVTEDGSITLNVESAKALNTVVGHEVAHILEGTELYDVLQEMIFDYAATKKATDKKFKNEYHERLYNARQLYKDVEGYEGVEGFKKIKREVVADLVGDYLFTDPDFINNLSTKHRNVFEKIYDEIKYLCKVATAGSKEARQLEKVKRAFEEAYRADSTAQKNTADNSGAKYSLSGITDSGIEVYETSRETMNLTWEERKAKYLDVMKNEYRGRTAKFERNGHVYYAEFDQSSLRKPIYGDKRSSPNGTKALIKAGADGDIFDLVENSEYRRSRPNTKDHTDADYFDYFVKTVQIDGKVFDLVADVEKKYGGDGGYVYTLALTDNKRIKASPTHGLNPVKNVGNASKGIIPQNSEMSSGNAKFSLSTDSEGKKLTKEQSEFFKDSKAVDKNGNLLKVYHTTNSDFTVFDKSKQGEATGDVNTYMGFFFADDAEYMQNFPEFKNGKTEAYYLNMKNPIDMSNISKEAFIDVVEVLGGDVNEAAEIYDQELSDEKDRAQLRGDNNTSLSLIRLLDEMTGDADYHSFVEELKPHYNELMSKGYDGVVNYLDELYGAKEYIVLDSNQAKLTSNLKPTGNADIRYSLSEDSQGRKLSQGQAERFKDSLVRDDNGKLYVVYHGSPSKFTEFKHSKIGGHGTSLGKGFYFTEDINLASSFYKEGGQLLKGYLDIRKPLIDGKKTIKKAELGKLIKAICEAEAKYLVDVDGYDTIQDAIKDTFISNYVNTYEMPLANAYRAATDLVYSSNDTDVDVIGELINAGGGASRVLGEVRRLLGYDGVIFKHPNGVHEFVTFESNQFKNIDNLNPTDDPDIRLSLSAEGEQPKRYGKYNVSGKDIMLEKAPVREEAPVNGTTSSEMKQVADIIPDVAPMTEEEANALQSERLNSIDDADAPPEFEAPYYGDTEDSTVADPFEERDIKEVGNRQVKAYMYENPEVKPFFQKEANSLLGELDRAQPAQSYYNGWLKRDMSYEAAQDIPTVYRTKRVASPDIEYLLDTVKMSYDDIRKGLNAIIEDHGAENIAAAKKIEFILNDRLMNGYTDDTFGFEIPANQDYINLIREKQITEYSEEAARAFFENADQYAPPVDDIAPIAPVAESEIAPTKEYEAIKPKPQKPTGEEAQWAKNKMARADKVQSEEQPTAQILETEPEAPKQKGRAWQRFVTDFVDKHNVFERLALKTKNRTLMAKANHMLSSDSRAQWLIGNGAEGVKSLNDIRAEVESTGHTKQFYEYLYHKHNVDRMNLENRYQDVKNKPVFGYDITAEKSQEIVNQYEFAEPKFKEYAQDVYDYMNYLRKQMVDNGVISQETADLWAEMYPHYVPIRRLGDTGLNINVPLDTGRTGVNAPIKRATGGNRDILPLFDTMAMRTQQTYRAIARNSFGVELKNTLGTGVAKNKVNFEEVVDSIEKHDELLQKGEDGRNPTFTVFENGEKVTFEITEEMYDALKPTSDRLAYTNKALNTVSNVRKGMITEYNPVFMITNALKDVQDLLINSQHPFQTYKNLAKAYKELTTKGKWYTEYMQNGGEDNTYFDKDSNTFKAEDEGFKKVIGMPLRAISAANNFIERAPRLAEYIASREAGASVEVAMLDAARVTTNFSAGGDVTKFLNRNGATFLNASVQGFNQQIRNIREAKTKGLKGWLGLAAKFAIAGLPAALLNSLMWEDDEEYEELSDYVKQNYYVVAKYGDGQFVRIPKGRTVAVIQNAFEQVNNALTGDDEVDFNSFFELFMNSIAPNNPIENNIFSPIVDVARNKTWYGEDLVPTRLQDLPAAEQYDESTDSLSRWLGETFNYSPYKINYLIDQYSGALGDVFLPMMTPEAESGDNSFAGNLIAPLKSKFTTDSVMNNQNVSDFYNTVDELAANANSSKATDEDILKYKYINSVSSDMSDLYKQKREIQNSDLPDDEKYAEVRKLQNKINNLARSSLNAYKTVNIEDGYAVVGDRAYRLNDKGEWVKLTDKQLESQDLITSALGITESDYWQNKSEYDFAYEYPEKYTVAKAVGGYDAYKAFASDIYDIKADKDKDGKSITGSRKRKVSEYINSLNADYGEKIIMFKSVYNADDTYNAEIVKYLDSRSDISYEEMIIILKELGFTISEDGQTVTW